MPGIIREKFSLGDIKSSKKTLASKLLKTLQTPKVKKDLSLIGVVTLTVLSSAFVLWAFDANRPLTLKRAHAETGYRYTAESSELKILVGARDTNKPSVKLETGQNSFIEFTYADAEGKLKKPKKWGNKLSFNDVAKDTDITYKTLKNGIKEEIVLHSKPDSNTFPFDMEIQGANNPKMYVDEKLTPTFYDEDDNYLFHFEKPFAYDEAGSRTDNAVIKIVPTSDPNGFTAVVSVDPIWLMSEAREYPIYVDPTIIYDISDEFDEGTFNGAEDTGSGASPTIEAWYQELPADEHTAGLWHLNEGTDNTCGGGEDACDSSGGGHHGTFNNQAAFTTEARMGGYAVNFDGTTDNINVPHDTSLTPTADYTLEAWIKTPASDDHDPIVAKFDHTSYDGFTLAVGSAAPSQGNLCLWEGDEWVCDEGGVDVGTDTWRHVAGVLEGSTVKLYVDGSLVYEQTTTPSYSNTNDLSIGYRTDGGGSFNGQIDEVRVSMVARTAEEIKASASRKPYAIYTSEVIDLYDETEAWDSLSWTEIGVGTGDGETVVDSDNLVAQYNLNETSGATTNNDAEGTSCGGTPANCDGTLMLMDGTGSQDESHISGWTADSRWGAGAVRFDWNGDSGSHIDAGSDAAFDISTGSISVWFNAARIPHGGDGSDDAILGKDNAGTNNGDFALAINSGTASLYPQQLVLEITDTSTTYRAASNQKVETGKWYHAVGLFGTGGMELYVNGVKQDVTDASTIGMTNTAASFIIGARRSNQEEFRGIIDEVQVYDDRLTADEIMQLYNAGNIELQTRTGNDISPGNGDWTSWSPTSGETQIEAFDDQYLYDTSDGDLEAYWPLNETADDTCSGGEDACDIVGTAHGVSTSSPIVDGVHGNGRGMRNSVSYVQVDGSNDLLRNVPDGSVSLWFNHQGPSDDFLFDTTTGNDNSLSRLDFRVNSSQEITVQARAGDGESAQTVASTDATVTTGKWHHIVVNLDYLNDAIDVYLDGRQLTMDSSPSFTATATSDTAPLVTYIGANSNGATGNFNWNGEIDEVRVYGDMLTESEVFTLYAAGTNNPNTARPEYDTTTFYEGSGAQKVSFGLSQLEERTEALWTLDETNADVGGDDIYDASDNNNDGEFNGTNIATAVVDGVIGKARDFNGTDDNIEVTDAATLDFAASDDFTVEAWVKHDGAIATNSDYIVTKADTSNGGYKLYMDNSGDFCFVTDDDASWDTDDSACTSGIDYDDDQWHHVVGVKEDTTSLTLYVDGVSVATDASIIDTLTLENTNALYIGVDRDGSSDEWDGVIDEVRITNRSLNADEVQEIYKLGSDSYVNTDLSSTDLSDDNQLEFYVAADKPGSYLEATVGESDLATLNLDTNTVGLWRFDEVTDDACHEGTNDVCDQSGYNNHGDETGSSVAGILGRRGLAREFTGANDYISVADDASLRFDGTGEDFTIMAWVRMDGTGALQHVIDKRDADNDGWSMHITSSDYIECSLDSTDITGATDIRVGRWRHVACVFDRSGNGRVYLDGKIDSAATDISADAMATTAAVKIGEDYSGAGDFDGMIDDVRILNTALTDDQMRQAYQRDVLTHPINIQFNAKLNSNNLISGFVDNEFEIDETTTGAYANSENIFEGEKIIVREVVEGVEYIAQGEVSQVAKTGGDGEIEVLSWDATSTFPSGGFTEYATVFKWQREYMDLADITASGDINAITDFTLTTTNGHEGRTVWVDDLQSSTGYLTADAGSTITSDTGDRYVQYRAIFSSWDDTVSSQLSDVTVDYEVEGPASRWKFDEGADNTCPGGTNDACDDWLNGNDGAITGATWQPEDQCVSGRCLFFDGTGDFVNVPDDNSIDFDGSDSFTVSGWFRHDGATATEDIVSKFESSGSDGGYAIQMESDGDITFGIDDDNTSFPEDSASSTTADYDDGAWHHFAGVYNEGASVTLYLDGIQVAQDGSISATGTLVNDDNLYFGINSDGASNDFGGFLDDIQIHDYVLTAAQIKGLATNVQGASSFGDGNEESFLTDGLVGYWAMDETSADTCTGASNDSCDSSGFGHDGAWGGSAANSSGKFGSGVDYDGASDYIVVTDDPSVEPTGDLTVSMWFNLDQLSSTKGSNQTLINKAGSGGGPYYIQVDTGDTLQFGWRNTDSTLHTVNHNVDISQTNTWLHVVGVKRGDRLHVYLNGEESTNTTDTTGTGKDGSLDLYIGAEDTTTNAVDGTLDDVRIYNKALNSQDVEKLYKWAPGPIGHWALDEGTGTAITRDKSGNGYDLSLTHITETDWVAGKFGGGLYFDSTNDYASCIDGDCGGLGNLDFGADDNFSYGAWVQKPYDAGSNGGTIAFVTKATDKTSAGYALSATTYEFLPDLNTNCVIHDGSNSANTNYGLLQNSYDPEPWAHYMCVVDRTNNQLRQYVNGVLVDAVDTSTVTGSLDSSANFQLGKYDTLFCPGNFSDGICEIHVDEAKVYNYALSPGQVIETMNGGHPIGGSPVGSQAAYWKLDEGFGTVANNANDNGIDDLNLTLNSASWTTSGKIGKAWNGAGAEWMSIADEDALDFDSSDDMTITVWFKSDSATDPASTEYILSKETSSAGYAIYAETDGDIVFGIDDDATSFPEDTAGNIGGDYYDGNWHHLAAVKESNSSISLYVDGALVESDSSISATGPISNSATFYLGDRDGSDNGSEFNGDIDEVKVYRTALTKSQISLDMNRGSSTILGATSTESDGSTASYSNDRSACVPGDTSTCNPPVGHWSFDTGLGNTASDKSGNELHASLTSIDPGDWQFGKFGKAINFDGSEDQADVTDDSLLTPASAMTVSAWVYPDTLSGGTTQKILEKHGSATSSSFALRQAYDDESDEAFGFEWYNNSETYHEAYVDAASGEFPTGQWYHIVGVYDGSNLEIYVNGINRTFYSDTPTGTTLDSDDVFVMGASDGSNWLDGKVDDVRIYDYARTPAQIAWEYNKGAPLAHWKLDECTGTKANDAAGNGYDGIITIGGTHTYTSAGTCSSGTGTEAWNAGTTGKYNGSLGFDGSDDYISGSVQLVDAYPFAMSGWIKSTSSLSQTIFSLTDASASNVRYSIRAEAATVNLVAQNAGADTLTGNKDVTDGTWHHVVGVFASATDRELFIDGVSAGTDTDSKAFSSAIDEWNIGRFGGSVPTFYVDGQLDDIRFFNYAPTDAQIRQIYNQGSAIRFGPDN